MFFFFYRDRRRRKNGQISTFGSVNPFFPSFTRTGFSVLVCQTSIWRGRWGEKKHNYISSLLFSVSSASSGQTVTATSTRQAVSESTWGLPSFGPSGCRHIRQSDDSADGGAEIKEEEEERRWGKVWELISTPLSPRRWNLLAFHLAVAAAMNYACGVFEKCQEPTQVWGGGVGGRRLIVTLAAGVVDYKKHRCPHTTLLFSPLFFSYYILFLLPFNLFVRPRTHL